MQANLLRLLAAVVPLAAHAQPFAYVSNQISNSVSVINLRDNRVTGSLSIGFQPAGLAVAPDGQRLYVVNPNSNTLAIFNTSNGQLVTILGLGQQLPLAVAVSPNGQRLYVANAGNASVTVLNPTTFALLANIRVGFGPGSLAVSADSSRVYVANTGSNTVSVINAATNSVVSTIPVGSAPVSLALTASGNYVYVANQGSNSVSQIEVAVNAPLGTINLGRSASSIAMGPDGRGYVTSFGASSLFFIDEATNSLTNTVELPPCLGPRCSALGVAASADGKTVYVVSTMTNKLLVIDADTKEVTSSIDVGDGARGIALSPAPRPAREPANGGGNQ
jgi:YVTN family beta-propeller protein